MTAMEPLCKLIGINPSQLSYEENLLIEVDLFTRLCEELNEFFRQQHMDYFQLIKINFDKGSTMLDRKFIRLIIQDILNTKEYDLKGIAYYTDTYDEVVEEMVVGKNTNPSAIFLRKLIDLHRSVRTELYCSIIKKITAQYLAVA